MKKLKNEMVRNGVQDEKSMKWNWFKVPVKVEQINEYLSSETVQSQQTKYSNDEITSQGKFIIGSMAYTQILFTKTTGK